MTERSLFLKEKELENSTENIERNILRYKEKILPFYKSTGSTHQFLGMNDIPISCRIFTNPNATAKILLCTGYNESYLKYAELIMNLFEMGYSIFCFDHRGQGFSGRFKEQAKRGFVDNFANYVDDLSFYFENIVNSQQVQLPTFILAHSMGGAIATLAVCGKKINPLGVILSSPMHGIALSPYRFLEYPIYLLTKIFCKFGKEKEYVFGQTDCIPFRPFEGNDVTNSKFRYDVWRNHIAEIEDMQLGGPTFGWMSEAIKASRQARHMGYDNNIPFLLLQAENDTVVVNSTQDIFINKCANSEKFILENAQHEILMEVNFIREKALEQIRKFIYKKIESRKT
ncbi:alpha/beta fold hydrolase [Fluviispira vulneris]|uniref:alpha/beta fold hydrolase n=1 Tax=Fluviispira vulneris TaxID=2763012 RepID=UPI001646C609|nr:alpha/beta fold hydrolase [Fluviispira vulneris]